MSESKIIGKNVSEADLLEAFRGLHIEVDLDKTVSENILLHCAAFSANTLDFNSSGIVVGGEPRSCEGLEDGEVYIEACPMHDGLEEISVYIPIRESFLSSLNMHASPDDGVDLAKKLVELSGEILSHARARQTKWKADKFDKLQKA